MKKIILLAVTAVTLASAPLAVRADDPTNTPATDATATALAAGSSSTSSLTATPDVDPWQFNATPFMWFVQVNGKVKVLNREANVNVDFDQIINHLRGPPLMFNLDVRKKKFGFYVSPLYVKLSADANQTIGPLTFSGDDTLTLWVVESGAFYQIGSWGDERPLTLDALGGVRYWNVSDDLTLSDPAHIINFNHSGTLNLWDPFVGLRLQKHLTEKLSVSLTGEYGGFDISTSTPNDSWQALGTLGYDFTKRFTFLAGYRALGLNTYNQSGAVGGGKMRANLILQGAIIGFQFRF